MDPDKEQSLIFVNHPGINFQTGLYASNTTSTSISNSSNTFVNDNGFHYVKQLPVNFIYASQNYPTSFNSDNPVKDVSSQSGSNNIIQQTGSSIQNHSNGVLNGGYFSDDSKNSVKSDSNMILSDKLISPDETMYQKSSKFKDQSQLSKFSNVHNSLSHQSVSSPIISPTSSVASQQSFIGSANSRSFVPPGRIIFDRMPHNNNVQFVSPFHYATTPQGALIHVLPESCQNSIQPSQQLFNQQTVRPQMPSSVILRPGSIIQTVPSSTTNPGTAPNQRQQNPNLIGQMPLTDNAASMNQPSNCKRVTNSNVASVASNAIAVSQKSSMQASLSFPQSIESNNSIQNKVNGPIFDQSTGQLLMTSNPGPFTINTQSVISQSSGKQIDFQTQELNSQRINGAHYLPIQQNSLTVSPNISTASPNGKPPAKKRSNASGSGTTGNKRRKTSAVLNETSNANTNNFPTPLVSGSYILSESVIPQIVTSNVLGMSPGVSASCQPRPQSLKNKTVANVTRPHIAGSNIVARMPSGGSKNQQNSAALNQQFLEMLSQAGRPSVCNPPINSFDRILPPLGSNSRTSFLSSFHSEFDEFSHRGLKYRRQGLTISIPKPLFENTVKDSLQNEAQKDVFDQLRDEYLSQHLATEQPLNLPSKRLKCDPEESSGPGYIDASPSPPTLEDNIRVLYSKLEHITADTSTGHDQSNPDLPMLSGRNKGRLTPPMQIFHVPDLKIISRAKSQSASNANCPNMISANFSTSSTSQGTSEQPRSCPPCSLNLTFQLAPNSPHSVEMVLSQLMRFFSLPPSSLVSLDQVQTNSPEVPLTRVRFQPPPPNPQGAISVGFNPNGVYECEFHLRNFFKFQVLKVDLLDAENKSLSQKTTPLFVSSHIPEGTLSSTSPSKSTPIYKEEVISFATLTAFSSKNSQNSNILNIRCANCHSILSVITNNVTKKIDEIASQAGLLFRNHNDENPRLSFCGEICLLQFVKKVNSAFMIISNNNHQIATKDEPLRPPKNSSPCFINGGHSPSITSSTGTELSHPTLPAEGLVTTSQNLSSNTKYYLAFYADKDANYGTGLPVILRPMTAKVARHLQKLQTLNINENISPELKRTLCVASTRKWRGTRWLRYNHGHLSEAFNSVAGFLKATTVGITKSSNGIDISVTRALSLTKSAEDYPMVKPNCADSRTCMLCQSVGDAPADGPGRLLCYNANCWIHLNCMLWCFEVYESISGSLHNVDQCLRKALKRQCSHCGKMGAGLPCYNPNCTLIYHVPCARLTDCTFFTDRGMYCSLHSVKNHPMQLHSLAVDRRVYITRNEQSQFSKVIAEEDRQHVVRIGSLTVRSIGQLAHCQIESGNFHTRKQIYPVGFTSERFYWSMRLANHRAIYRCTISDLNGQPLFRITETLADNILPPETVESDTCDGVWKIVLYRVSKIRKEAGIINVFPELLQGEQMYGLRDQQIIRAIESLHGIDHLTDYAFTYGRMELIHNMPLPLNPSGCARTECRMKLYFKRNRNTQLSIDISITSKSPRRHPSASTIVQDTQSLSSHGRRAVSQFASSESVRNRAQQYRRLKSEAKINVFLGRSGIQGLGLYAARDLEPQTMVIEYIGELIRLELANKREKFYESQGRGIYMFRLDDQTVIDATMTGGLARYVNHSCQPNCYTEYVNFGNPVGGSNSNAEGSLCTGGHIVIITNQRIAKGQELCYDYKFDLEDCSEKIPCLCKAPNCRKWMN